MINLKFTIQESGKVKKLLGVYYEWGQEEKVPYAKMTMDKEINKMVDWYKKFIGSDVKFQKTLGGPGTTLNKSDL